MHIIYQELFGNGTKADRQAVPAVDGNNRQRQVDQFFVTELRSHGCIDLIWHMINGNERHGLRPRQGRPLPLGIEWGLAPGYEFVEALFGFAARPRRFGVQIDSIRAPIDLRRPNFHQFNEQWGLSGKRGRLDELVQAAHRSAHAGNNMTVIKSRLHVHRSPSRF